MHWSIPDIAGVMTHCLECSKALHVQTCGTLRLIVHNIAVHHPSLSAHQISRTACSSQWACVQAKSKMKNSAAMAYV